MARDELSRLARDGRHLISDEFLRGEAVLTAEVLDEFIDPAPEGATADLERLDRVMSEVAEEHSRYDTAMDRAVAIDVHQTLNLTRRAAGDPGIWHWLTVVRYDDFVRHRWEYSSEAAMREKFLGAGTDLYSNALHRLWWIAELTQQDGDYSLTEEVLSNQTMVNKVFDRWFARYRPATIALCDELSDEPSSTIDEVTRRFNHALTTFQLEGLDEEDVRQIVSELKADVR